MYKYSFQKLEVWQLSIKLTKEIYQLISKLPSSEKYGLSSQIKRALFSVSSNLAEGSSRVSEKDQARFFQYSFSSMMEVISQLHLCTELGYISTDELKDYNDSIDKLCNKINALYKRKLASVSEPQSNYGEETDSPVPQFHNNGLIEQNNYHFHYTSIINSTSTIGSGTKIWHFSHIMSDCTIGEKCNIGQNVVVSPEVVLGNNVKIQNNVSIYTGVTCDDDVFLGPSMVFTNVTNPRSAVNRRGQYAKTHVGKGATIGANATIVCGHDIGAFAFIGAGSVVTKTVKSYALVVGNPAKQIGWMSEYGHRLKFDENGIATCQESGENYTLKQSDGEEFVFKI